MYKIAILGCENSHAKSFLDLIAQGLYPDIEVIGVFSEETEAAVKLQDSFGVPVMKDYAELAGKVDGIMVTARHGDNHYKYAKPYLNCGIPMFIDKPITCDENEGVMFMREAKQLGVRLCGGSTCAYLSETLALADVVKNATCGDVLGGSVVCPYYPDSPYGGFYFYAQHLVDVMTAIFGTGITQVRAERMPGAVTLTAQYDGFGVQCAYVAKVGYYSASVYGSKGICTQELKFGPKSFIHEMDEMLHLLKGGQMRKSYDDFIQPVFVMNAILRSIDNGGWATIPRIEI